ncbi:uncharacterized protein MONOS_18665 [Monocercomonoides exilis]|uniref:uncharacterized protein n=1 Tax=Monocercomonoides exilis TaxID=2049356 RepID=UPI003559D67F|nr:hypothetical protein MONOS_18665 [Monocercomonoides exilis]
MRNAIFLLKHVGFYNVLKDISNFGFEGSTLKKIFEKMIIDEEKKKEEKNEKLLVNLCECYIFQSNLFSYKLLSICVSCLLKVALKKEGNEETQKEVEMALLALSCFDRRYNFQRDLFLNEIKEIILNHQMYRNLTRLAYQSAWEFLINRLPNNSLEEEMVNELHIIRESIRELEELSTSVDWKKKEEEMGKTERKAMHIISRWIRSIGNYFYSCKLWNEEYVGLISRLADVFLVSRDNYGEISKQCIYIFETVAGNRAVKLDTLLKSSAIDAVLEEIYRPTLNQRITFGLFVIFDEISKRLKEEEKDEKKEAKRKATKRKVFVKQEEEGYEDIIISFHEVFRFFCR